MRWNIRIKHGLAGVSLLGLLICTGHGVSAQVASPPAPAAAPAQTGTPETPSAEQRRGGFVPGQKRAPGNPAQITRGKTLYEINCRGCHGADLRGGDLGGPNLLRSQLALSDLHGELIVPVIQGSRQKMGMPKIGLSIPDSEAVAAYVRSVIESIQGQGAPPSAGRPPVSVVVGNASEGKAYFATKCASCHSATGDLQGIATKISDPKKLQTAWVAGGARSEEEGGNNRAVNATVTLPSGEKVEGKLLHLDDFLVVLTLPDGTERSFTRDGDTPNVAVHDPMETHRNLLSEYTDKDIHDVTAYLVTLK